MTNPFASLRQETQGLLPEPWYEYPLLKEFDLEVIYNKDKEYLQRASILVVNGGNSIPLKKLAYGHWVIYWNAHYFCLKMRLMQLRRK